MATVRKMKDIVPEYVSKHSRYEVLDAPQEGDTKAEVPQEGETQADAPETHSH